MGQAMGYYVERKEWSNTTKALLGGMFIVRPIPHVFVWYSV
jgi:hypothetical protein